MEKSTVRSSSKAGPGNSAKKGISFKESVLACTTFTSLEKVTSNGKRRMIFGA